VWLIALSIDVFDGSRSNPQQTRCYVLLVAKECNAERHDARRAQTSFIAVACVRAARWRGPWARPGTTHSLLSSSASYAGGGAACEELPASLALLLPICAAPPVAMYHQMDATLHGSSS
jgi:hypothetical protein